MNGTTKEWLRKADGDYHTACREFDADDHPNFDAVCYHGQQCIEKMMKALLMDRGVVPPRTHNLLELSGLLQLSFPQWTGAAEEDLRLLTAAAVAFRYPSEFADREDAAQALAACSRLRELLSPLLPRGDHGKARGEESGVGPTPEAEF